LFFIDRVNVKTFWEPSLWMVDEVTQLLSTKNLKEIVGKNELVRSKLLEQLNSLFLFSWSSWCSTTYNRSSSSQENFFDRPPI